MRAKLLLNCGLMALLFSISTSAQTINLKIIETSDVHGALFPSEGKQKNSLASIYSFVRQQRANDKQETILLDDGDILQGEPVVYYSNFERPDTEHICSQVMNFMAYDAATLGNHDIEAGHPVYDRVKKEFKFPWLAANAVREGTGEPYFEPYKIMTRKGVKIAVLGLTTPGIPSWLPEKIYSGINFTDMKEAAKKWVRIIKEKERPDLIIGLFHSGFDYSYGGETREQKLNENASRIIAEDVPGFDLILIGHDHHGWNEHLHGPQGDVLLLGTTNSARDFAVADIRLDYVNGSYKKTISGSVVKTANFHPDEEYLKRFNFAEEAVKAYVAKPVGRFTKTISTRESLFGDSPFVDLIQRIQLEISGAEISLAAPLLLDTEIKSGEVFVRDMFKLYKFENLLYTMSLSGSEIKKALEFSYDNWFAQMNSAEDHMLKFKTDKNGNLRLAQNYYNFESAAGINYRVDLRKPEGQKVKIISMANGDKFDTSRIYRVAVNSYRGNGGGGHLIRGAGISKEELPRRIITSTEKDLRFYLMKWIEKKGVIDPESLGNWSVEPKDYVEKASKKDYDIIFDRAKKQ